MSDMKLGFIPYEMKTTLIKITSYKDKTLQGVLSNPCYEQEKGFNNAIQFLVLVEGMLDKLNYPQKAMESRSIQPFSPSIDDVIFASPVPTSPPLATFRINVLFRQNASWQGRLIWVENKSEAQFRSVLELIMLMDSVLS